MDDEHAHTPRNKPILRRVISGPLLVLYGLGAMIGAGVYALIGEVVGAAGVYAPAAFISAAIVAAFTGVSFAELSSRFPRSAGEAVYVSEGFHSPRLSLIVGLMIVASGVVSSGVMFRSFAGYANELIVFPEWFGFAICASVLGAVAAWGIAESLVAVAIITIIEAGVLVIVIGLGISAPPVAFQAQAALPGGAGFGIASGAVLAFYAFIGFEDMVNVAEEVKKPRRTLPLSIIIALAVAAVAYVAVAWAAVRSTPIELLAQSPAPMTLLFSRLTGAPAYWISIIAIISVSNGALVQIVMASRVLYGLGRNKMIVPWFGRIASKTQTPVNATLFVVSLIFISALFFPLVTLAQMTSLFLLSVFTLVNIALIRLKRCGDNDGGFNAHAVIPYLGALSAMALAVASLVSIAG